MDNELTFLLRETKYVVVTPNRLKGSFMEDTTHVFKLIDLNSTFKVSCLSGAVNLNNNILRVLPGSRVHPYITIITSKDKKLDFEAYTLDMAVDEF